jgi:hypothetical protein
VLICHTHTPCSALDGNTRFMLCLQHSVWQQTSARITQATRADTLSQQSAKPSGCFGSIYCLLTMLYWHESYLYMSADGGISMQPEQKREVDALIQQLEEAGRSQRPRPLQNPLLFGNYNVAYTSSGEDQRGQRECSSALSSCLFGYTWQQRACCMWHVCVSYTGCVCV